MCGHDGEKLTCKKRCFAASASLTSVLLCELIVNDLSSRSSTAEVRVGRVLTGREKEGIRFSMSNVSRMQRSQGQDGPIREERRYVGSEQMCEDDDKKRNITSITLARHRIRFLDGSVLCTPSTSCS
jgi:hypothetical protein